MVAMDGWKRPMSWRDTGRRWVAPSPNLRTGSAALAYPGVALLEATNVSEGRGTDAPFLLFGAPWLDPSKVRVDVPGFRLTPTRFTPKGSPAAPEPKHRDVECAGFRIEVTDPKIADSWRLGVELLATVSGQPGFEWLRDGEALTTLLGTPGAPALAAGWRDDAPALAKWRAERRAALLYD